MEIQQTTRTKSEHSESFINLLKINAHIWNRTQDLRACLVTGRVQKM